MSNYWLKYHMTKIGNEDYANGIKDGIFLYAHYHDGVMMVGTTGRTYQEAIAAVDEAHKFMKDKVVV